MYEAITSGPAYGVIALGSTSSTWTQLRSTIKLYPLFVISINGSSSIIIRIIALIIQGYHHQTACQCVFKFIRGKRRERERERAREFALILYHRSQRAGNCLAVRRFVHEREAVRGNFVFTKALIPSPKRDIVVRSITCVLHDERPGLNPPE